MFELCTHTRTHTHTHHTHMHTHTHSHTHTHIPWSDEQSTDLHQRVHPGVRLQLCRRAVARPCRHVHIRNVLPVTEERFDVAQNSCAVVGRH